MLLIQEAREEAAASVLAIATKLALRYPKAPAIAKMGQNGTVADGPFRPRDEVDVQEGEIKLHIPILLGK